MVDCHFTTHKNIFFGELKDVFPAKMWAKHSHVDIYYRYYQDRTTVPSAWSMSTALAMGIEEGMDTFIVLLSSRHTQWRMQMGRCYSPKTKGFKHDQRENFQQLPSPEHGL